MQILRGSKRIEYRNPYLPLHWDDGIKTGLAAAATGFFTAVVKGDSISQGQYPGPSGPAPANYDYRTHGWWHQFMDIMRARYAARGMVDGGEFFSPLTHSKLVVPNYVSSDYVGGGGTGLDPYTSPNASNITKLNTNNGFWRLTQFARITAAEELLRFNAPAGTIKCDAIYGGVGIAPTVHWKYQWGLGGGLTWPNTVAVTANDGEPHIETVYNGVASQGPLYLGSQDAAYALALYGVTAYKNTHGLLHGNMAYGGIAYAHSFQVLSSLIPPDKIQALWDTGDGYTGYPRNPNLVVLAMGTNDNSRSADGISFGPTEYRAALASEIVAIRRFSPNASIIILLVWHSSDYDDQNNAVNNSSWPAFIAGGRQVAEAHCCGFVDFSGLMNPTPVASGYIGVDAHPKDAGYTFMANTLGGMLP